MGKVNSKSLALAFMENQRLNTSKDTFLIRKFGKIDATVNGEIMDIINHNFSDYRYKFTTTEGGEFYYICSTDNTADQLAVVTLLDVSGAQVVIPVVLTGQTPVLIPGGKYTRHQTTTLFCLRDNKIQGHVYVFETAAATNGIPDDADSVRGFIKQGENRTQQAIVTVPTTHYGYLNFLQGYINKKVPIQVDFTSCFASPFGSGKPFNLDNWPSKQIDDLLIGTAVLRNDAPIFNRKFDFSNNIHPGTDISFNVLPDANDAGVACEFDLILVRKDLIEGEGV